MKPSWYVQIGMCGRKLLIDDPARLRRIYGVIKGETVDFLPSYNLPPIAREPIVRLDEQGDRVLDLATWDYDKATLKKRPPFFNARSEAFVTGEAFLKRRCLVPANGFYKWAVINGKKQPFVFLREDREVFSMGGCWKEWHGSDGTTELTYVELTTEPNTGG